MDRFDDLPDNLGGALIPMLAAFGFALTVAPIKLAGRRPPLARIPFVRQLGMTPVLAPVLLPRFSETVRMQRLGLQLGRVALAVVAMTCGFTAVAGVPLADATALGFAEGFS